VTAAPGSDELDDCGYCPFFQHASELIGRRWTGSIIKVLSEQPLRFSQMRSVIPGLSDRLLHTRLTELEAEGIVERSEDGAEVRYGLTAKGTDLEPVIASIAQWAEAHSGERSHAQPGKRR